jgi:hypothetical protein
MVLFREGMMTANAKREMNKIKSFIRELSLSDTNPAQLDTYYPLENFEYRGWEVEIERTPNMMRGAFGTKEYTVRIHR